MQLYMEISATHQWGAATAAPERLPVGSADGNPVDDSAVFVWVS